MDTDTLRINCRLDAPLPLQLGADAASTLPDHIQWMPPGKHTIWPENSEEPYTVDITEEIAAKANAQLQEMRQVAARGEGNFPYIDFNHEDREQSGEPLEFFWGGDHPKEGGVRMRVRWSDPGAQGIRGRAFRSFSPSWVMRGTTHQFLGVGLNVGGLVNRSAFQAIQAVARGRAASKPTDQERNNMTEAEKREISEMITGAVKPLTDQITVLAKLPDRIAGLETKVNAKEGGDEGITKDPTIVSMEARIKSLETGSQEAVQANAKRTVEELGIKAGRIAAQDKDSIEFWEGAIATNAKAADALAKMPVNPAFQKVVAGNGSAGTTTGTEGEHAFIVKAREHAKARNIEDPLEAEAAFASTPEGQDLYRDYRESLVPENK